jgi:anthranilate phosphoribosyltransferase
MSLQPDILRRLNKGLELSISESSECLTEILSGQWTLNETASFLEVLRQKGESISEIVGFAQTLRKHMRHVPAVSPAIDLCGTGGGPPNRYNVSTASAFVLAQMGIGVAKHGNRGSRQPNGSFDFIEALGLPVTTDTATLKQLFRKFKLCFLYARTHHPAIARVADARKLVGGRTIFNLIGPLCNPAGATQQVLGVSDSALGSKMSAATKALGQTHVVVVSGESGYDEVTPFGETHIWDMRQEQDQPSKTIFTAAPEFICTPEDLHMTTMSQTIAETHAAFSGQETPISRYIALNTGAGLYCAEHVDSLMEGAQLAKKTLRSGVVLDFLNTYSAYAKEIACPS